MIRLKTEEEIKIIAEGGQKLGQILRILTSMVKSGATTDEIDKEAESRIKKIGGIPAFKGYRSFGIPTAFPGTVCVSINEEIVHGLPYPVRQIKEGDIVTLDIGMKYKGYFTDTAFTVGVERLSVTQKELINVTKKSLELVLEELDRKIKSGERIYVNDVGAIVEEYVSQTPFHIVQEMCGHGVGKTLHEEPNIPNYYLKSLNQEMKPGTVVAIEPMLYAGEPGVIVEPNSWKVYAAHGGPAAHFEHTIAIMEEGLKILTSE